MTHWPFIVGAYAVALLATFGPHRGGASPRCAGRNARRTPEGSSVKAKNQRLTLLVLAIAAVLGAVLLAMSALKDQAAYFYAPGDLAREGPPVGRAVRIGGMVQAGSLKRAPGRDHDPVHGQGRDSAYHSGPLHRHRAGSVQGE
jgi:hypothetical protein